MADKTVWWLNDKRSGGNSKVPGHLVWCCVCSIFKIITVLCDVVQQGEVILRVGTCLVFYFPSWHLAQNFVSMF